MGCPLSFRLLFTYCSWELPEQNRKAVLTPEGMHSHSSGLFLPLSIFPNSNFVLITCKLEGLKCLKISRNTEVQDNILMPWKPSKYGDYLNLEGSWLTFRSASPKRKAGSSNLPRDVRKHRCKPFLLVCSGFCAIRSWVSSEVDCECTLLSHSFSDVLAAWFAIRADRSCKSHSGRRLGLYSRSGTPSSFLFHSVSSIWLLSFASI